ncbi:hypothetical protein [Sphingopyxis panaciterrulae]|uniref:Uncharacterized protein n=1 Tax=Sphingopyxis panaciterrulae TaxID=462372 RepID=A0A7W9ER22_9SPHN|nr:hypothetical protein [Sphingopyxis panaciterrulae]MBB5705421.1 hypothetical protein [Sphingopyxis panaciterrulae]
MIGGAALSARAIAGPAHRDLPSSWGGPDPMLARTAARPPGERATRQVVRKP